MQIKTIFFSFWSLCLLFLFLASAMVSASEKGAFLLCSSFRKEVLSVSPLNTILAVGSFQMPFVRLRKFLLSWFAGYFLKIKNGFFFGPVLFLCLLKWPYGFQFYSIYVMDYIDSHVFNRSCIPGINSTGWLMLGSVC